MQMKCPRHSFVNVTLRNKQTKTTISIYYILWILWVSWTSSDGAGWFRNGLIYKCGSWLHVSRGEWGKLSHLSSPSRLAWPYSLSVVGCWIPQSSKRVSHGAQQFDNLCWHHVCWSPIGQAGNKSSSKGIDGNCGHGYKSPYSLTLTTLRE